MLDLKQNITIPKSSHDIIVTFEEWWVDIMYDMIDDIFIHCWRHYLKYDENVINHVIHHVDSSLLECYDNIMTDESTWCMTWLMTFLSIAEDIIYLKYDDLLITVNLIANPENSHPSNHKLWWTGPTQHMSDKWQDPAGKFYIKSLFLWFFKCFFTSKWKKNIEIGLNKLNTKISLDLLPWNGIDSVKWQKICISTKTQPQKWHENI